MPTMTFEDRANLSREVYETICREAGDLENTPSAFVAYLMGAILKGTFVNFNGHSSKDRAAHIFFRGIFPKDHQVWNFIQLML